MPELPDVAVYIQALEERVLGARLVKLTLGSPFILRSVSPAPAELDDWYWSWSDSFTVLVPEPGVSLLLGVGLLGTACGRVRRRGLETSR